MKAFIWNKDFLTSYSSGIGFIVANTVEEARAIGKQAFVERNNSYRATEFDPEPDEIIEGNYPLTSR